MEQRYPKLRELYPLKPLTKTSTFSEYFYLSSFSKLKNTESLFILRVYQIPSL